MIALDHVTVQAGGFVLRGIQFEVRTGAYAVLMGRTGSGKTTLLEAICGLRRIVDGTIRLMNADVTQCHPAVRGIGFVPQDGALFEHMTVREHLGFALRLRRWPRPELEARVAETARWLDLTPLLDRRPRGLSGGEIRRVALGRALSFHPRILCLDEPLSALDDETRASLCELLQTIHRRTGVTVLHITHNLSEARQLADSIFQIREGRVESA